MGKYRRNIYDFLCGRVELPQTIDNDYVKNRTINGSDGAYSSEYSWGLCGKDMTRIDMDTLTLDEFKKMCFDSKTHFSNEQLKRFNPFKILEAGKSFSKDMDNLHEAGFSGTGINIGIIDTEFDYKNAEFLDDFGDSRVKFNRAFYPENYLCDHDGFHGKAVTSISCGRSCGVASNSNIYLFNSRDKWRQEERLEILKYILQNNIKLDIISMSSNFKRTEEFNLYREKLLERGCQLIDSGTFWQSFSYGRKLDNEVVLDEQLELMYQQKDKFSWDTKKILERLSDNVIIPCSGRTHLQVDNNGFMYNGVGCASWSIPQVSGLFAIAKQIDPNIKYDEFVEIVNKTSKINLQSYRYINPVGIVREINERNRKLANDNKEYEQIYQKSNTLISNLDRKQRNFESDFKSKLTKSVDDTYEVYKRDKLTKEDDIQK